jgi:hypothetical protein
MSMTSRASSAEALLPATTTPSGWPTYRTSAETTGTRVCRCPGASHTSGSAPSRSIARSGVITALTSSSSSASAASKWSTRPCAMDERTMTACSMPGSAMSSM